MTAALWIIAICSLIRVTQNERQLQMMEIDKNMFEAAKQDFINEINDSLEKE